MGRISPLSARCVAAVVCFSAAVANAAAGLPVLSLLMSITGGVWTALAIIEWRKSRGSDRQAQASPQDPDPSPVWHTHTLNPGGPIAAPCTFTITSSVGPILPIPGGSGPEPELEVVESEVPILAQRAARLLFKGTSKHWGSLNGGWKFGIESDAKCDRLFLRDSDAHDAPSPSCTCGFYAVPCDVEPWTEGGLVTLLVELSGTVIEHELGYRAGHQRVVECRIPPCRYCGAVADVIDVREGAMQSACCEAHTPRAEDQVLVSIDDLSKLLPVPVTLIGRTKQEGDAA